MRKFIFFLLIFIIFIITGFYLSHVLSKDVVEGISGVVSYTEFPNKGNFVYLDLNEEQDSDNDGLSFNDKDAWVSGLDKEILEQLSQLNIGDYFYAKDLWSAKDYSKTGFNHFYVLEFYEIKRK